MKADMRVILTKRLLKGGLLRMLEKETLSKISISEHCQESDVNRATFYRHYESPSLILRDIAYEYYEQMGRIYKNTLREGGDDSAGIEACMTFLLSRIAEINLLFSKNAESCLNRFALEIINEELIRQRAVSKVNMQGDSDDYFLYAVATASAAFGLIEV